MASVLDTLTDIGVAAFGLGMPTLASAWTDGTLPYQGTAGMSLELSNGHWQAPLSGELRPVKTSADLGVTLVLADGALVSAPGTILTVFPHVYLRLTRLYAQVLEAAAPARPERALGLPARPVPRYFYCAGMAAAGGGKVAPGADLGVGGDLTVHDECGLPIDPVATAAAFFALMSAHHSLQERAPGAAFDTTPQLQTIAQIAGAAPTVRLRLSTHSGTPYDGTHLTGVTAVDANAGVFTLDAAAGGGSDLTGSVNRGASTGTGGTFPDAEARVLKLGFGTTGRLTTTVSFPALATGVTLARDFFALRVVKLDEYLLGSPDPAWDGTAAEPRPAVRIHEPLDLLADGNDVLGAAFAALTGASTEVLVVAQSIDGTFSAPSAPGTSAHWPAFPAAAGAIAPDGPLPLDLRTLFNPTAAFLDDGDASTANVDVILTLSGLPANAAVRVYNRRFVADAREERGDGAGGVANAAGTVTLRLRDPLGLRTPGLAESAIAIPTNASLHCDVVVVKRKGESRVYGGVVVPLAATPTTSTPAAGGPNPFGTAARRAVSTAGVLGLKPAAGSPPTDLLSAALTLFSGGNPRDAPRLPTMARRELIVAGLAPSPASAWKSVLAGGRLTAETHSAAPQLGAPGSPGGRETQVVGVSTQTARLAYDVARMAFRRTTNVATRLEELAKAQWDEPAEPAELAVTAPPTSQVGTFAGAVLQTIARGVETPELGSFRNAINVAAIPTTFDQLVDWTKAQLTAATNAIPAGAPKRGDAINGLNQLIAKLDDLKDNQPLTESTKERLYSELRRELTSSCYGRRDAQWALRNAIAGARRFIYVESPGFTATSRVGATQAYAVDLVAAIASRLSAVPGLRVLICTPKHPAYGAGYEPFASGEVAERLSEIEGLPTATSSDPQSNRVVAFHPIGFPGRPSGLESTVVVVDDIWALVGSSTWRRRGMTFDGGTDIVFSDTNLVNGVSPSIQAFRRKLLAARLGVPIPDATVIPVLPDSRWVRLADGHEATFVVREALRGVGLGRIERYWRGQQPGFAPPPPFDKKYRDPDAEDTDYDLAGTIALATIAALDAY
jgi:hypothetical protein